MPTHSEETRFFGDESPFAALQHKLLPELIDGLAGSPNPERLRIWSAGCGTGQEPYSIAMAVCETLPEVSSWDIQILATDLSDAALARASRGWYTEHEIQCGLTPQRRARFFQPDRGGWRAKDDLRWLVSFQRLDLLQPFADLGPFDVIFCRNVANSLDAEMRRDMLHRLCEQLPMDGWLLAGSTESLAEFGPQFTPQHHCGAACYQPNKQNGPPNLCRDLCRRDLCPDPRRDLCRTRS